MLLILLLQNAIYIIHLDIISTAQVEDARVLQSDKFSCKLCAMTQSILDLTNFVAHDSQGFEEQRLIATIKQKGSDLAAERKEKSWLEEKCENLEQELKKVRNEKSMEIQVLQAERKELEEKCEDLEQELKKVRNEKSMEIQVLQVPERKKLEDKCENLAQELKKVMNDH